MSPGTTRKRAQLERLAQEISAKIPNSWLYPQYARVQGFHGIGPIMLVGERPSTGVFPSRADTLLYRALDGCRASEIHLTDVIKSRGTVGEPYPPDMGPHKRFFLKELDIVRPRTIIAMGQKVHDLLQFTLADQGIQVSRVLHYSYLRRRPDKYRGFVEQLRAAMRA